MRKTTVVTSVESNEIIPPLLDSDIDSLTDLSPSCGGNALRKIVAVPDSTRSISTTIPVPSTSKDACIVFDTNLTTLDKLRDSYLKDEWASLQSIDYVAGMTCFVGM